jgi:microcystin-dependent protein
MNCFIGQVETFAFGFAPRDWLPCDGRLLRPDDYPYLFNLIGDTYGGDGTTSFALPKLGALGPQGPNFFIAAFGEFPTR